MILYHFIYWLVTYTQCVFLLFMFITVSKVHLTEESSIQRWKGNKQERLQWCLSIITLQIDCCMSTSV